MYNVDDYFYIKEIRSKLSQCFSHTYQQKRYVFYIFYIYSSMKIRDKDKDDDLIIMNSMLNLLIYARKGAQQHIYELLMLKKQSFYMIEVLKKFK